MYPINRWHAKDGINLKSGPAYVRYGVMNPDGSYTEYKLGDGGVPFPEYIAALKEVGYDGFLTIEREAGATRFEDIRHAVAFLSAILEKHY